MRKLLLSLAALAATTMVSAQTWEQPVYSGSFQPLTTDAVVYIFNTESKLFLTEGNDWGTHASVGNTGLQCKVTKAIVSDLDGDGRLNEDDWDGKTYNISVNSVEKSGWNDMFIDGVNVYVDRREQENYYFSFTDLGNNTYSIYGADINPIYNAVGEMEGYVLGHYKGYINDKDRIQTGTGVIYDSNDPGNYNPGEFTTTWAFVSEEDYLTYVGKAEAYNKAVELKTLMDEASAFGVDITEAKKAYDNTNSTAEELADAISELNRKILAYYETSVTPDNPKDLTYMLANPTCDAIDGWANNIGATTWNTQTWIDEGWEGMEGTTLNVWGASLSGTVSQNLTGLPNGIYIINIAVFSEKMEAEAYANENAKAIPAGAKAKAYQITTEVKDGEIEFGVRQNEAGTNWIAIDNASVKYYGSGVEAYRYWLNGLLESAPSFEDDVTVQKALLDEYEGVLASINTVQTKDDILGIIPAYEEILNKISLNIEAYDNLKTAMDNANMMTANPDINSYYGEKISDYILTTVEDIIAEHELNTEEVNAQVETLNDMLNEAKKYLWNMDKFKEELTKAEEIYNEFNEMCDPAAATAYEDFKSKADALDATDLSNADILKLLDDLYAIEFNLQKPAEPASDDNPVDYTAKIFNPAFDGVDGWTNEGWNTFSNNTWYGFANEEGASSGDGNYLNLWNEDSAKGYQMIANLPAGAYTVQFGAYADNEGFQVYANENKLDIPVGQINGNYMSVYTIDVIVGEDGKLEIGVLNTNGGTQWAMVDEFHLTYFGTDSQIMTGISEAHTASATPAAIYTVSGTRVSKLQKGINIIKYNNTTKKIYVK